MSAGDLIPKPIDWNALNNKARENREEDERDQDTRDVNSRLEVSKREEPPVEEEYRKLDGGRAADPSKEEDE